MDDGEDVEADDINKAGDDVVAGRPVAAPPVVGAPAPGFVAAAPAYSGMLANCRE